MTKKDTVCSSMKNIPQPLPVHFSSYRNDKTVGIFFENTTIINPYHMNLILLYLNLQEPLRISYPVFTDKIFSN